MRRKDKGLASFRIPKKLEHGIPVQDSAGEPMSRWLRPWWIVAIVALGYMAIVVISSGGDPLALATIGTHFSEGDPDGTGGYDGQFSYINRSRPAERLAALRRACTSLPAHPLSPARPAVGLWPGALGALWSGLGERGYPCSRDLFYGGNAPSLQNESLVRHHLWPVRRPAYVHPAAGRRVAGPRLGPGGHPGLRTRALALGVGVPCILWQAALWAWLGSPGLGSGGSGATNWEIIPFRGLWSVGAIDIRALVLLALVMVPLTVIPTLLSLWATGRALWRGRRHPFTSMLLPNALTMVFLPQSTYREPLAMLRLSTGLVSATILYGAAKRSKRILNYTLLWLASLVSLTKEGPVQ
jgi:hypothetical protein